MIDRRSLITASTSCLLSSFLPVPSLGQQRQALPDQKGKFIRAAIAQLNKQKEAERKAAEKRGEFSSVSPPLDIAPFADWDFYYVKGSRIVWSANTGQTYTRVIVPIGFVSDLASVPAILWSKYPPQGRYAIAAIIHDYLYWTQQRTREEADDIFYTAMQDTNVPDATRKVFWTAVRARGQSAWTDNAKRKASGERRFLRILPPNLLVPWENWKKQPNVFADLDNISDSPKSKSTAR